MTACLGYAFWGIYSIGSIAECNKNTATMLLEALSLGIYLWLPMAVLTNYGSWNQKIYPFSRMPVAAKIILEQLALLMETNRKQSEIIESQAKTIEELRATIVELNASLAWLKRKVFGNDRKDNSQWESLL